MRVCVSKRLEVCIKTSSTMVGYKNVREGDKVMYNLEHCAKLLFQSTSLKCRDIRVRQKFIISQIPLFWSVQRSSLSWHLTCYRQVSCCPLCLPWQLLLSSRLWLTWLSSQSLLSPSVFWLCFAHLLLLHPLVGPATDWWAVDPTTANKYANDG